MIYLDLFIGFLKVGFFSFGGAYGAIPLIRDVVLSHGWMSEEELVNMIAVSESTPGPIMVNLATYIGSNKAGFPGALLATLTVAFPSFIIILITLFLLKKALENRYVQAVLEGLKPSITGIILATGLYMIISNLTESFSQDADNFMPVIMTVILFAIYYGSGKVFKKKISPIAMIVISAVMGVIMY
ncbi:MAG: chromate transporter [Butyrivibrio sp.]|uniref:chromate transporter n=1 Tax=Butyrivibrio sp. TaxID=28121 RepID=UPI0025FCC5D7|nr:chromate transporter [Butyrivibrio sp.]MCR5772901.1 chromate transporter [Butyrivibrio sp.]